MPLQIRGDLLPERIALLTDFGQSPYVGQLHLLGAGLAPGLQMVDLIHDLPAFRPDLAAYMVAPLVAGMPGRTLYLCVVDPGVGSDRCVLVIRSGDRWFVGPDNGLLSRVIGLDPESDTDLWRVDWRPEQCSQSFHGRDVFLPIALALAQGRLPLPCEAVSARCVLGADWPRQRSSVLYIDGYGNLLTGLSAAMAPARGQLSVNGRILGRARTFCEAERNSAFWYGNAFGLVEVAVNQGRAHDFFGCSPGDPVSWLGGAATTAPNRAAGS